MRGICIATRALVAPGERFGHLLASLDRCLSRLIGEHEAGTATLGAQRETVAVSLALHPATLASHGVISLWLGNQS